MANRIDPNKVAIYGRYSTEDQGKGWTKEVQIENCAKCILARSWNVNQSLIFFDEGKSGANMDRPELTALRQAVKEGKVQAVVSYKLDRLSRSVPDAAILVVKEWNNNILFVSCSEMEFDTSTLAGRNALYVLAMVAENERENIRIRTSAGRRKNAENGLYTGTNIPYGYSVENGHYVINPITSKIVARIFNDALTKGFRTISQNLNLEGVTSPTGKGWLPQTINYMVKNKFYLGIITFGKTDTIYKHMDSIPALVSQESFDAVQIAITNRNVSKTGISGRTLNSPNLLTGIAYCTCGSKLKVWSRIKGDKKWAYYRCRAAQEKGVAYCNNSLVDMQYANQYVISTLDSQLLDPKSREEILTALSANNKEEIIIKQNEIKELEALLVKIQNRLKTLDHKYMFPEPGEELRQADYNDMKDMAREMLSNTTDKLQVAKAELDKKLATLGNTTKLEKLIYKYSNFSDMSISEQKALLRELIEKVLIYKPKGVKQPIITIIPKLWAA